MPPPPLALPEDRSDFAALEARVEARGRQVKQQALAALAELA